MFKNWKRIAGQAAARADALESEKRAVEHRNDHLRAERVKMLKELDTSKVRVSSLEKRCDILAKELRAACAKIGGGEAYHVEISSERDALAERLEQIAACETTSANGTVRRMARIARGEDATAPAAPSVDAGPVPNDDPCILDYRDGKVDLNWAFIWRESKQGFRYWCDLDNTPYADLPPEPKAIINAWIAELEAKSLSQITLHPSAMPRVDAGPVPKSKHEGQELKEALQGCLDGTTDICAAFTWRKSKQGSAYWLARSLNGLDDEAREIIKTWIVELEAKQ